MRWSAGGVALGLPAAFAGARILQSLLRGVSAADPIPMAAAALLLFAATYAASYVPAKRASRTDVMAVLREHDS
jgi:ABC-type antimicrobial peptide transport system permease subunit